MLYIIFMPLCAVCHLKWPGSSDMGSSCNTTGVEKLTYSRFAQCLTLHVSTDSLQYGSKLRFYSGQASLII